MTEPVRSEVTDILLTLQGDQASHRVCADRLFEHVYNELHRIAVDLMHPQRVDHTLQPTALVHEAYLRLVDQSRADWQSRAHFCNVAARAMRQILVDHERHHRAAKRGGGRPKVTLDDNLGVGTENTVEVLELDEALTKLAGLDERMARVVEIRVFAGMTASETAFVLGISERTVHEDWRVAKMWLLHELSGGPAP
jgi:RNA polymerase sigma factor (TIGR02999 family)